MYLRMRGGDFGFGEKTILKKKTKNEVTITSNYMEEKEEKEYEKGKYVILFAKKYVFICMDLTCMSL